MDSFDSILDNLEDNISEKAAVHAVKWKTFTLTHIDYPDNDVFGKFLAVLSLLPLVIVVSFITAFALQRDLHTFFYGIGVILNGILNYILKHTIKETRPDTLLMTRDSTKLFEEYGMPSSHTQFMWFVAVYLFLFLSCRLRHQHGDFWKYLGSLFCFGCASLVSYGRIYLHYHTLSQVGVGAVIGGSGALVWFWIVQYLLTPCFPWIASLKICEFLMIRDYTWIPNVMWFEYCNARSEARNRSRKISSMLKSQ